MLSYNRTNAVIHDQHGKIHGRTERSEIGQNIYISGKDRILAVIGNKLLIVLNEKITEADM